MAIGNFFVNHYGEKNQIEKLQEEALELVEAIEGWKNGKDTLAHIKEEIADVENLSLQLQHHWNDGEVYNIRQSKIHRQMERIEKEKIKCIQPNKQCTKVT